MTSEVPLGGHDQPVLGMLGGMAWPSTLEAYRLVNERVGAARGGVASPELLLWSADFAVVERLQADDDWTGAGELLAAAAAALERAGAGALVLLTNTMHRVAPAIEDAVDVPLLHVADATAATCRDVGARTVGLLGTRFTMEQEGVADRLAAHGLAVLTPDRATRRLVHDRIYDELVRGEVSQGCRLDLAHAASSLVARGAEAVVAGCTEIELALAQDDVDVPLVATTSCLVDAMVDWLTTGTVPRGPT